MCRLLAVELSYTHVSLLCERVTVPAVAAECRETYVHTRALLISQAKYKASSVSGSFKNVSTGLEELLLCTAVLCVVSGIY
jgi:hypothetical protein